MSEQEIEKIDKTVRCPTCGHRLGSFHELMEHQKTCNKEGQELVLSDHSEPFVNIHVHSEFSILDGVGQITNLVAKAAKDGAKSLCLTDHGTVSGHIAFQQACEPLNVNPIFGSEFYICSDHTAKERGYQHLILIAKNEIGHKNLIKLSSKAAIEGFYYKPRIDFEMLKEFSEGLICTSACIGGEIPQAIMKGDLTKATDIAMRYKELFGSDFYLEIQPNRIPHQATVNKEIIRLSKELDIQLIATNDAHYPNKEDWKAHEIVLCIKSRDVLSNPKRFRFDDNTFWLMTGEEIKEAFAENHPYIEEKDVDIAMSNSQVIADKCDFTIQKKDVVLPAFNLPEGYEGTENGFLDYLCEEGMTKNYVQLKIEKYSQLNGVSLEEAAKVYQNRLDRELDVVHRLGFERYVYIVWDLYEFCRSNDIAYGPGRGSVAGALFAYLIGITTVDPIENDLLFERFLSPERIDMPDIDMDFEDSRRQEVIQHMVDLYGKRNVSNIVTYNRLKGKSTLKDVSRVFNVPYAEVNAITDFIIERSGGDARVSFTIEDSIESFKEVKEFAEKYPDVIKYSKVLEGQIRQKGIHAAGVIVSENPIDDVCPIEMKDDKVMSSYDFIAAENMGLLKLDVLGLRTMSIINNTLKAIAASGKSIVLEEIPLDDEEVFRHFSKGNTSGVFQLETKNMTKLCRQVGVESFEDIVNINALGRPGTMRSGLAARYIRIKHGKAKAEYIHPLIEKITKPTHSIMLYQEQIMFVLADIGNFDWSAVDVQRKIISKSQGTAAFEQARDKFIEGATQNGVEPKLAHDLYSQMIQFGSYSFNKSHSAAYSTISYWCVAPWTIIWDGEKEEYTTISKAFKRGIKSTFCYDLESKKTRLGKVKKIIKNGSWNNGKKKLLTIRLKSAKKLSCTPEHKILTSEGYKEAGTLMVGDLVANEKRISSSSREDVREKIRIGILDIGPMLLRKQKKINCRGLQSKESIRKKTEKVIERWKNMPLEEKEARLLPWIEAGGFKNVFRGFAIDGHRVYSLGEKLVDDWLSSNNIVHETQVNIKNKFADFKARGIYIEFDGMNRPDEYFQEKFGEEPFIVVKSYDNYEDELSILLEPEPMLRGEEIIFEPIVKITYIGEHVTYDIVMEEEPHNFIANGIVVHNCLWLKNYYPNEFFAALLSQANGKEHEYVREARKFGVKFEAPNVNKSEIGFKYIGDKILCGLQGVEGLGGKGIQAILDNRPYKTFDNFISKTPRNKVQKKAVEALIMIGAFGIKGAKQKLQDFKNGKDAGQSTLSKWFGEPEIVEDWTEEEVQDFQSKFYVLPPITHPIEKHYDFLKTLEVSDSYELIGEMEHEVLKGKTIWVRGIITLTRYQNWGDKMAEKPTPDHPMYRYYQKYEWNARHCLFDIEDETGFTLCSVYPDVFELIEPIINKGIGVPVLVKGKMGHNLERIYVDECYEIPVLQENVGTGNLTFKEKQLVNHPLSKYKDIKSMPLAEMESGGSTIGIFGKPKLHYDKNDNEMAFVPFSDRTGEISLTFFSSDWKASKEIVKENSIAGIALEKLPGSEEFKPSYKAKKIIIIEEY